MGASQFWHRLVRSIRLAKPRKHPASASERSACVPGSMPGNHAVSVVIPVYGKGAMTRVCLDSVFRTVGRIVPEVIVVDDCSPEGTLAEILGMNGVRILRNERNLGFIGSCNRGAEEAIGDVVVFLNNDTICLPGWLDALVGTLVESSSIGLVGAQLIYPDGTLQESGAIVWRSGEAQQIGRGRHPGEPEFSCLRDVDYCSGACIALRRNDFTRLGMFDSLYAPAYYEDTDLAFRVRKAGMRVVVQPASRVIHLEGATGGTDTSSGVKKNQVENRVKFRDRWRNDLDAHFARGTREELAWRRHKPRLLVVDTMVPRPDKDSGSVRMAALLECAVQVGFDVVFCDVDPRQNDEAARHPLAAKGVMVLHRPWWGGAEEYLAIHGAEIDAVILCRPNNFRRLHRVVRRFAPRAALVYDTIDLHCLRLQRELEINPNDALRKRADRYRDLECMAASRSDLVYVVSSAEIPILMKMVPEANVRVLSNIHEPRGQVPGPEGRNGLLFLGGFQHAPNIDAVMHFIHDIFPKVRERFPETIFRVVGSDPPPSLLELSVPGVEILGYVENIDPILDRSRIMVAPLRFGAGVKGKINTAMANGLPVVTSKVGAEGMGLVDGKNCLIADEPGDVAAAIARLILDDATWSSIAKEGFAVIADQFSRKLALDEMQHLKEMVSSRFDR